MNLLDIFPVHCSLYPELLYKPCKLIDICLCSTPELFLKGFVLARFSTFQKDRMSILSGPQIWDFQIKVKVLLNVPSCP